MLLVAGGLSTILILLLLTLPIPMPTTSILYILAILIMEIFAVIMTCYGIVHWMHSKTNKRAECGHEILKLISKCAK